MNRGQVVDVRSSKKVVWGGRVWRLAVAAAFLALAALGASCGDVTRQGSGSSYLIINAIEAASGAEPTKFASTLLSDVVTVVNDVPSIFNDVGRVRLVLAMKDAGGANLPTAPTTNNFITVNRYHVQYVRADGRNIPGVDVPYPFDGAFTATVGTGETTAGFDIVRHDAKAEAPLGNLARNGVIISTIAQITFYGSDQTGHEVSVAGQILVSFGNFGDPSGS
jgi:hypothetical protein